jgi:hypothetical protein
VVLRTREIACDYQPYIFDPPVAKTDDLYNQACRNDGATIDKWLDQWLENIRKNHETYGPFKDRSLGSKYNEFKHRPCILVGSGPSLKYNVEKLKDRHGMPLISCLHNFHYLEEHDVAPEYYVTLDAGPVTVEEVTEGGSQPEEWYWERTKDRTLIAFIGTHPSLLEKWQGQVLFYNAPVPDERYQAGVKEIEDFNLWVSNGGNVLGSCLYISKAILGSTTSIFVGADFSFGYDKKFHSWSSKYDANMGRVVPMVDVFGNRVAAWQSYANFKAWFDWVSMKVPGEYINCTEGGCFGAYPNGNLVSIKQMDLADCLDRFRDIEEVKSQCLNPEVASKHVAF